MGFTERKNMLTKMHEVKFKSVEKVVAAQPLHYFVHEKTVLLGKMRKYIVFIWSNAFYKTPSVLQLHIIFTVFFIL